MEGPWKRAAAGPGHDAPGPRPKAPAFALWRNWGRRDGWRKVRHADPYDEHRAYRDFNRRYLRVEARAAARDRFRSRLRRMLPVALAAMLGAAAYVAAMRVSPWPEIETLQHIAAFPNCAFARIAGVAPAVRGQPGYYERHDADGDGIACEPVPAWKTRRW